jgi:hypothetical protein
MSPVWEDDVPRARHYYEPNFYYAQVCFFFFFVGVALTRVFVVKIVDVLVIRRIYSGSSVWIMGLSGRTVVLL